MRIGGKPRGIGLDLEDNRMRLAALGPGSSGLQLEGYGERAVPAEALENGRIKEPEVLGDILRDLWSSLGIRESRVVAAVPSHQVFVRSLVMPVMKKRDIFRAARYHFLAVLPLPLEEAVIQVSGVRPQGAAQLEATLVGVRKSQVRELTQVVVLAGLKPAVIEIRPLALRRLLGLDQRPQILVDSGQQDTHLSYFDRGQLRFSRSLFLSGAGEGKGAGGPAKARDGAWGEGPGLEREIRRSLEYWSRESGGSLELQKLVVTGPGSPAALPAQLGNGLLSVEVEWGSPWRVVREDRSWPPPEKLRLESQYGAALGLALRGREGR